MLGASQCLKKAIKSLKSQFAAPEFEMAIPFHNLDPSYENDRNPYEVVRRFGCINFTDSRSWGTHLNLKCYEAVYSHAIERFICLEKQ